MQLYILAILHSPIVYSVFCPQIAWVLCCAYSPDISDGWSSVLLLDCEYLPRGFIIPLARPVCFCMFYKTDSESATCTVNANDQNLVCSLCLYHTSGTFEFVLI